MSTEHDASTVPDPSTNSVEPPPMSITRNGRSAGSSPRVAPSKARTASCAPETTSGSTPSDASAMAEKSARLPASRIALVATMRRRSTPSARQRAA
jgi:hypothetical protein